jgi:hypothetical protein
MIRLAREGTEDPRTITDSRGSFAWEAVPEGTWTVLGSLGADRAERELGTVQGRAGEDLRADLSFPAGPLISGRVSAWDRRPVQGFVLEVHPDDPSAPVATLPCRPESGGRFTLILEASAGRGRIRARAEGYSRSLFLELPPDGGDVVEWDLRFARGFSAEGQVLDEEGRPVPRAQVRLNPLSRQSDPGMQVTDGSGRFAFDGLEEGDYAAFVRAEGFVAEPQKEPLRIRETEPVPPRTLRVRRGWSISGRVSNRTRQPVSGARIEVREGERTYEASSGTDGSFTLGGIDPASPTGQKIPGIDQLTCSAEGFGPLTLARIHPGDVLDLTLDTAGRIELEVTQATTPPPADFAWSAFTILRRSDHVQDQAAHLKAVRHDGKGPSMIIGNLAPGDYEVHVTALGFQRVQLAGVAVRSGETTPLKARLVQGTSDLGSVSLSTSDPEKLREELRLLFRSLPPERREPMARTLRQRLKEGNRNILETVLGELDR